MDTPLLCVCAHDKHLFKIDILLRCGADSNVLDTEGTTCLNLARGHADVVKLLIDHGANPSLGSRPFFCDAAASPAIDIVKKLASLHVDCNVVPQSSSKHTKKRQERTVHGMHGMPNYLYPLHLAADKSFARLGKKTLAIKTIKTLLEGGANPGLVYDSGRSIVHSIAEEGGFLEPFLTIAEYEVESRDFQGMTLLLAACSPKPPSGPSRYYDTTAELASLLL